MTTPRMAYQKWRRSSTRQQHAGRKGKLGVKRLEEHHEARHDECGQHDDDADRHAGHDGRVDESRGQRRASFHVALDVVGQLVQHGVQVSGQLGRLENAHVEVRKCLGMRLRGSGECVTGSEVARSSRRRTFFMSFSVVSSSITSRASMIGMPAFMKTPICREKCMTSLRGTFFLVTSMLADVPLLGHLQRLEAALDQGEVCCAGRHAVSTRRRLRRTRRERCSGTWTLSRCVS